MHSLILILPLFLFAVYFLIARKLQFIDQPNGRSSHINSTITGSGIVFSVSLIALHYILGFELSIGFIAGLSLAVIVSFADDMIFIKHSHRFIVQLVAVSLLVLSIPSLDISHFIDKFPIMIGAIIFGVFVLNGLNFMDGINGMLGLGSLIILLSLAYLNLNIYNSNGASITFIKQEAIYSLIVTNIVFLFLNLRAKAKAFMGDAGSIGIGFAILYMVYMLIAQTGNISYLLLFSVYGIDSGLTVIYKLILKENVFVPHRDFLFKKLVHIGKYGHVRVSVIYASVQLLVNSFIIFIPIKASIFNQIALLFLVIAVLTAVFIRTRNRYTKTRLIRFYSQRSKGDIPMPNNYPKSDFTKTESKLKA